MAQSSFGELVWVPGLESMVTFRRDSDFLGKGTVGEVFRAQAVSAQTQLEDDVQAKEVYALKIFLDRSTRPHFKRECRVLDDLSLVPHENIVQFLHCWKNDGFQYILFPIATSDLYTYLRETAQPRSTPRFNLWYVQQLRGLCSALSYIHSFSLLDDEGSWLMRRIGFHHDLKPVNILLFECRNEPGMYTWKISDFGSGFVSEFTESDQESVYNSVPSTGDPIYTAPEFVLEGRVSRPKDVWSLGCIFLETLIWITAQSRNALDEFQKARFHLPGGRRAKKPMYWYQDDEHRVHTHPAVVAELDIVHKAFKGMNTIEDVRLLVCNMLTISRHARPNAQKLFDGFDAIFRAIKP